MPNTRRHTRRSFVAGAAAVLSGCLGGNEEECDEHGGAVDSTEGENGGEVSDDENRDGDAGANESKDGTESNDSDDADEAAGNDTDTEGGGGGTSNDGTTTDELDLREANVVAVSVRGEDEDGTYTFDVTLHHDDDGEEGYANWWQVESLDGECLGRRNLTHPHGTRPFTRSTTVDVGEETCVVVRGHDQTHGYGGRVVVVNLETAATRGFLQGEEPSSFDEGDCP